MRASSRRVAWGGVANAVSPPQTWSSSSASVPGTLCLRARPRRLPSEVRRSPSERIFLAEGLRSGQPAFLAATGAVLDRYVKALNQEQGVDFDAAERSGRMTVVGWPGATVAEALANWERLFGKALAGGPTILRVVGEMACERSMFSSDAEMLAYEEAYEVMARRYPAVTLCQYDAREFNGEVILRVLKAHPDMFQQHLGGLLNYLA